MQDSYNKEKTLLKAKAETTETFFLHQYQKKFWVTVQGAVLLTHKLVCLKQLPYTTTLKTILCIKGDKV